MRYEDNAPYKTDEYESYISDRLDEVNEKQNEIESLFNDFVYEIRDMFWSDMPEDAYDELRELIIDIVK